MKFLKLELDVNRDGYVAYFTGNESERKTEEQTIIDDDDESLVFGKNSNGVVTYGCIHKHDRLHGNKEYRWSSRASVFNTMLDTEVTEQLVFINEHGHRMCHAMDVHTVLREIWKVDPTVYGVVVTDFDANGKELERHVTLWSDELKKEYKSMWNYYNFAKYSDGSVKKVTDIIKYH